MMPAVSCLVVVMVQMIVDPQALPHLYMVSLFFGKIDISEVLVPPLDLPGLSLPSGLLEEMFGTLDLLIDLAQKLRCQP